MWRPQCGLSQGVGFRQVSVLESLLLELSHFFYKIFLFFVTHFDLPPFLSRLTFLCSQVLLDNLYMTFFSLICLLFLRKFFVGAGSKNKNFFYHKFIKKTVVFFP